MKDIPRLYKWLHEPPVHAWYDKKNTNTPDAVLQRTPYIKGEIPTNCYLLLYEAKSEGYIQTYTLTDKYRGYEKGILTPDKKFPEDFACLLPAFNSRRYPFYNVCLKRETTGRLLSK